MSITKTPQTPLVAFISKNGGTIGISKRLGVTRNAVYAWITRKVLPQAITMQRIVKLSKGRVSYDSMIDSYRTAQNGKSSKVTRLRRRRVTKTLVKNASRRKAA